VIKAAFVAILVLSALSALSVTARAGIGAGSSPPEIAVLEAGNPSPLIGFRASSASNTSGSATKKARRTPGDVWVYGLHNTHPNGLQVTVTGAGTIFTENGLSIIVDTSLISPHVPTGTADVGYDPKAPPDLILVDPHDQPPCWKANPNFRYTPLDSTVSSPGIIMEASGGSELVIITRYQMVQDCKGP
jgi:hypothetical protein